jgi:hypothetical protein
MQNKRFEINETELDSAKEKVHLSYSLGYAKDNEKPDKANIQKYYAGWRDSITGALEYYDKGYTVDLKQSHQNHGFYIVYSKPVTTQTIELKTLYNRVEDQFKSNLEAEKRLYVEQQIAFEDIEKQAELNKIKEKELAKKVKMKEAQILKKVAAL